MPGLSLRGLDESAWWRHMDVVVDGRRRRNRKGDGKDIGLGWLWSKTLV